MLATTFSVNLSFTTDVRTVLKHLCILKTTSCYIVMMNYLQETVSQISPPHPTQTPKTQTTDKRCREEQALTKKRKKSEIQKPISFRRK